MKRLPILFLLLAPGYAADPPPAPPQPTATTRIFPLKYADAEQVRNLFSASSYPMSTNRDFNVLLVTSPPGFQAEVEAAIKQFDIAPTPPKNVELTIYLLNGSQAPGPTPLPKELQEVEKQLVSSSSFKAFKIADSQVIRIRPGQPGEATGGESLTQIRFRAGWINSDDKGKVISFDGLRVQLKNTSITTDIDLRENQWAIIGTSSPDGILVAMARVSE
jgi:hypothetical protein